MTAAFELGDGSDRPTLFDVHDLEPGGKVRHNAEMLAGAFIAGYDRPQTRRSYSTDLRDFMSFLMALPEVVDPVHEVKRGHVDVWARAMEDRGLSASTVNRRIGTVGTWYRWLVAEEYIDRDPTMHVRRPKVPRESTREWLTRRELADWISCAEKEGGYPYALACLLAFNGLRIGSVCAADVEGLGREKYHRTLDIVAKGNQPTRVALPARTVDALKVALDGRDRGPLILNTKGTRLDREAAGRIVGRFAYQARITKRITPHSLRHSAITAYLEHGADISAAADFAGHADLKTTQRYDRRRRKLDASGSYAVANFVAEVER